MRRGFLWPGLVDSLGAQPLRRPAPDVGYKRSRKEHEQNLAIYLAVGQCTSLTHRHRDCWCAVSIVLLGCRLRSLSTQCTVNGTSHSRS